FALRIRRLLLSLLPVVQGLLAFGLGRSHLLELLPLGVRSCLRLLLTCADEVELQGRGLGRILGPARRPGPRLGNVAACQQPVRWPAAPVPFGGALKVAGVLAQPLEVGIESRD